MEREKVREPYNKGKEFKTTYIWLGLDHVFHDKKSVV
jgi:hypothetical protein